MNDDDSDRDWNTRLRDLDSGSRAWKQLDAMTRSLLFMPLADYIAQRSSQSTTVGDAIEEIEQDGIDRYKMRENG